MAASTLWILPATERWESLFHQLLPCSVVITSLRKTHLLTQFFNPRPSMVFQRCSMKTLANTIIANSVLISAQSVTLVWSAVKSMISMEQPITPLKFSSMLSKNSTTSAGWDQRPLFQWSTSTIVSRVPSNSWRLIKHSSNARFITWQVFPLTLSNLLRLSRRWCQSSR